MVDYNVSEKEKEKILESYFKNGKLTVFPSKMKRKKIILDYIVSGFDNDKEYTEKEINSILGNYYDDHVTLRRALIDFGFMERSVDCSIYKVKLR